MRRRLQQRSGVLREIISWQMRESLKSVPLPNIFYHILYAIHYNPSDPVLGSTCLHPVDVTELLQHFAPPYMLYEDTHYEKCQQILSGLSAIGLSERQRTEFLRIISAILVAGKTTYSPFSRVQSNSTDATTRALWSPKERAAGTLTGVLVLLASRCRRSQLQASRQGRN